MARDKVPNEISLSQSPPLKRIRSSPAIRFSPATGPSSINPTIHFLITSHGVVMHHNQRAAETEERQLLIILHCLSLQPNTRRPESLPLVPALMEEVRFAEELYAESLQLSKLELRPTNAVDQENKLTDCDGDDLNLDGSLRDGFDDKLGNSSDLDDELDREWQRRHDQFHTSGYRDGLIAGQQASAQEGFNIGFKQSVLTGYSWGVVRGVTSAFAYHPDQLKEKLVETLAKRNEFQGLYESVHSLSTTDALRLFNEDIKAKEAVQLSEHVEVSPQTEGLLEQTSGGSRLGNYLGQLESLIRESPGIDIHLPKPG